MPDQYSNDYESSQGECGGLSVARDARKRLEQSRQDAFKIRRETRARLKDEAAGLTPEMKVARERKLEAEASKRYRDRKKVREAATNVAEPPTPARDPMPGDVLAEATRQLDAYLVRPGRRQRMIAAKGTRRTYLIAQRVMLRMRYELNGEPGPAAFASRLNATDRLGKPITPNSALHLLRQLREIEAETGPWIPSMTAGGETSPESITGSGETMTAGSEITRNGMTQSGETLPEIMTEGDETSENGMTTPGETMK